MPLHSPEDPDSRYELDYPGEGAWMRARVTYHQPESDEFTYDPDAAGETSWLEREVFNEPVENVDLNSDDGRRRVAQAILTNHLKTPASDDDLETFMTEIVEPDGWENGQTFTISGERLSRIW